MHWKRRGFALSLDAAIAIIISAVLLAVGSASYYGMITHGKIERARSEAAILGAAVSEYKYEIQSYPSSLSTLTAADGQYGPWITSKLLTDPWHDSYQLITDTTNNKFVVYSRGKDLNGNMTIDGTTSNGAIGFVGK
jgi:type II secretory pathway pseudopilin PulG